MKKTTEQAAEILKTINEYYEVSFCISSEKCMPFILQLIEQLQFLLELLDRDRQQNLNEILCRMLAAMEEKDGVLLRDLLHYDLRTFIMAILN